jgi:hypothetical protein
LVGTVSTGSTTTSVTTSTVITGVGINQFANRGDTVGYRVRIVGAVSGKTEERTIIANSSGTTPTLVLDSALSFTPASGDVYEILGGKVYMLSAGTLAAGCWKSYEIATGTTSGNLATTNLPATISTDFAALALDELHTPLGNKPSEGMILGSGTYNGGVYKCLVATATGASSITGQAADGDAVVAINEFRNFQIRVVEDTTTPTAVGQRRMIASHTAGASPVYTLGTAWSVQPSANAKYVIEFPNLIILRSSATSTVYTYNYSGATVNNGTNSIANDAWSTTYFGAAGAVMAAGCVWAPSWGITPDTARYARNSYCYFFRGTASTVDMFDIAGGTTGAWTSAVTISGAVTLNTGSCSMYSPFCGQGKHTFINAYTASAVNQMYRFDSRTRTLSPLTATDWIQSGTAAVGGRIGAYPITIGADTYSVAFLMSHLVTNSFELIAQA